MKKEIEINKIEDAIYKEKYFMLINFMMNKKEEFHKQIAVMKPYSQMMLDRNDNHGLWDSAIDVARIGDKIELLDELLKVT